MRIANEGPADIVEVLKMIPCVGDYPQFFSTPVGRSHSKIKAQRLDYGFRPDETRPGIRLASSEVNSVT